MPDHAPATLLHEGFFEAIASGLGPTATACKLGIPVGTARRWTKSLIQLAETITKQDGLAAREWCKKPILTGITLVHSPDKQQAKPGDIITLTAWVMNDTREPLHKITIIHRSFTNAGMDSLHYTNAPNDSFRSIGSLLPGEATSRTYTYQVTETDLSHRGALISALGVHASTSTGKTLWDECDAVIELLPTLPDSKPTEAD